MKLAEYHKKRNFKKTSEPSGEALVRALQNIFVVQKHQASHLHYDFRLAIDGVLKSWAVPKGPSLNPKDKRLAVMTEDHPLEYANFEGAIPEGEYGAGTVEIWDKGTWEPINDVQVGLSQRKLEFILHGKKLNGAWVLVGFKNDPKNWLLIKKG
ncbi:MAG: DNA polymerase ligase N-terminal domain-containing protein [bacterium]